MNGGVLAIDGPTWAAWAQAAGTVAAALLTLVLIRQERAARRHDEDLRRQDLDRATIAELQKARISVSYEGGTLGGYHDLKVRVCNDEGSIGLRSVSVHVGVLYEGLDLMPALFEEVTNVSPRTTKTSVLHRVPWNAQGPPTWVLTARMVDAAGGKWDVSDLGLVTRAT